MNIDHVFIGTYDGIPEVNKNEVEAWKFMDLNSLRKDMKRSPESYTVWFRLIINHPEWNTITA